MPPRSHWRPTPTSATRCSATARRVWMRWSHPCQKRNKFWLHSGLHSKISYSRKCYDFSLKIAKTALYLPIKRGNLAESQGFEPWRRSSRLHDFQSCAFDHSANSPNIHLFSQRTRNIISDKPEFVKYFFQFFFSSFSILIFFLKNTPCANGAGCVFFTSGTATALPYTCLLYTSRCV